MKLDLLSMLKMIEEEDKKLEENKLPLVQKEQKTALDLQGLFSLFEEVEPTLKEDGPIDPEIEPENLKKGIKLYDKEVLDFIIPEVVFRETDVIDNKKVVDEIKNYLTGDTVVKRLKKLIELSIGKDYTVNKNTNDFKQLINKLAMIDGILSIFKSFEATTAGSVAEQVVANLFPEAQRLNMKETTEKGYVTDVIINDNHYVIKAISADSKREMSAGNFAKTLLEEGAITLLDCIKQFENTQVVGLVVFEKQIMLGGDYNLLSLKRDDKKSAFIQDRETKNEIKTVEELINAWRFPEKYLFVDEQKEVPLEALKDKHNQVKVPGFTSYKVSYKPDEGELIELKKTSEEIKKQISYLTMHLRDDIIRLKNALQTLAIGMSKFFVTTGKEKGNVKKSMLDAARQVSPKTKAITADRRFGNF